MAKKRYAPEQIVEKIREADVEVAKRPPTPRVRRRLGGRGQMYYRWRDTPPSGLGWGLTEGGLGYPEFAFDGGRIEYLIYRRTLGRTGARLMEVRFGGK